MATGAETREVIDIDHPTDVLVVGLIGRIAQLESEDRVSDLDFVLRAEGVQHDPLTVDLRPVRRVQINEPPTIGSEFDPRVER